MRKNRLRSGIRRAAALALAAGMTIMTSACGLGGSGETGAGTTAASTITTTEAATMAAPTADANRKTTASGERYDKISIGMISDPKDLSPISLGGSNSQLYIFYSIYEPLFDYRDNNYEPILAKGYKEIDDTHWQVELYDYIYDSEGNHITADDVVYSFEIFVASGRALKFDSFESIKKIDDYTVEFTWTGPINSIGALEWPWCRTCIISKEAFDKGNFSDTPVGTGPYKVTEFVPGAHVIMEANDAYWQKEELRDPEHLANVQTVQYDVISETSQHVIALSTGQIQYSEYVPSENIRDFQTGGKYSENCDTYITQGSALYVMMANNAESAITTDENLRKAIYYALDNDAIAMAAGSCLPAHAFGTPFFPDYDEAWESQEGNYMGASNLELAKQYLEQSGYQGETIRLLGVSEEVMKNMMTMSQALLLQAGINVEIIAEEEALQQTDMQDPTKWELLITKAGGGNQIGEWNRPANYNEFGTGYNMAFIHDEELQRQLLLCKSLAGHTAANMGTMHQYMLDNAYYYAICAPQMNATFHKDFATLIYRENEFLRPGACEYYLD